MDGTSSSQFTSKVVLHSLYRIVALESPAQQLLQKSGYVLNIRPDSKCRTTASQSWTYLPFCSATVLNVNDSSPTASC